MTRFNIQGLIGRVQSLVRRTTERVEEKIQLDAPPLAQLSPPVVWVQRTTWIMMGTLSVAFVWSVVARIDMVVPTRGKLEPISSSQSVQSRVGGVVTAVLVKDGQSVRRGQLLMQLDKTQQLSQLQSLSRQRKSLVSRILVLSSATQGRRLTPSKWFELNMPPELISRVQDRNLLVAQLNNNPEGLAPDQMQRYTLFAQEIQDLQTVNRFQVDSLQVQAAGADASVNQVGTQLNIERSLVSNLDPLVKQGAISRTDYLKRVTDLNQLQNQFSQARVQRSQSALTQMQTQVDGRRLVADRYRDVQNSLAALDSQIHDLVEQDQKQLVPVETELERLTQDLLSQDLRAPVDGIVFDMAVKIPGLVTQSGQALMQITPNESLVARLQVSNTDIALLRSGMPVELRLDAYPFTEFGSVPGVITRISSDASPTDPQAQSGNPAGQTFYQVEVRLNKPFLEGRGQRQMLAPGMALTANVKTDSRAPITFLLEQLLQAFDGARTIR